jgi:hypothetical protein
MAASYPHTRTTELCGVDDRDFGYLVERGALLEDMWDAVIKRLLINYYS